MRTLGLCVLLLTAACKDGGVDSGGDLDGDGLTTAQGDCDDSDAAVSPLATETPYDGVDNDCDANTVDDDLDGDGFGVAEDCDDADANFNPDAPELCDGWDNNCDGVVDEGAEGFGTWYPDGDGDGYGVDEGAVESCAAPEGYAAASGDCDDGDPSFHPGAREDDCDDPADYNCDGSVGYEDADGDGYAACAECDDGAAAVYPGAAEACDELDNDCDSDVDEGLLSTWFQDADGDGHGDADQRTEACTPPSGYVQTDDDCDDGDASVSPSATELCNGQDDDCDGQSDEADAADAATWYRDADADGYGSPDHAQTACEAPVGYVSDDGDCDDLEPLAWTGATESCDEVDNDCDGDTDEGVSTTWTYDYDGDGYGDDNIAVEACTAPASGFVSSGGDCDDRDVTYSPGATEGCDGEDYNCDGAVDHDADADGYADATCGGLDCDDTDASVVPESGGGCALGADCQDILTLGRSSGDGVYSIDPDGFGAGDDPFDVYCDMSTDGGGWTLVMKQASGSGYGSALSVGVWPGWSQPGELLNESDATLSDDNMVNLAYSVLSVSTLRLTASTTWVDTASGAWTYSYTGTPYDAFSDANGNTVGNLGGDETTPWTSQPFTDASITTTDTGNGLCWRTGPWFNQTSFEYTNGGVKWGWMFNNECYQYTTDTAEGLGCCGNSSWYRGSAWTLYLWGR
ncbi:MAG: hypothetical protein H6740_25960 [Alphaproteobacteria bacterium]|nr:hypothetical protein [Alphaproteobacteria bacterium]